MAVPSQQRGRDNLTPNQCGQESQLRKLPNIINNIYNDIDHIDNKSLTLSVQEDDGSPTVEGVDKIVIKHGTVEDLQGNAVKVTPSQPVMIVKTPAGGIAATTSNTSMSSASCTEWYQDNTNALTESTNTITVYNIDDTAVPANAWGVVWYNFTDEYWYTNSCCWNTTMTTVGSVTDPNPLPPTSGVVCTDTYCTSNTAPYQFDLTIANITTRESSKGVYLYSRCINEPDGSYSIFGYPNVTVWWDEFCEDVFNNTFRVTATSLQASYDPWLGRLIQYITQSSILNWVPGSPATYNYCLWQSQTDLGLTDCCGDYQCDQPTISLLIGYIGSDPADNLPELNSDGTRNWIEGAFFLASLSSYRAAFVSGGFGGGFGGDNWGPPDQLEHIWGYKSVSLPTDCGAITVTNETAYTELTIEDYTNGGPLGKTWLRNCQAEEPTQNQTGTGAVWSLAEVT